MSDITDFQMARILIGRHPRMTHLCETIECPHCDAGIGEHCRTRNGNYSAPHTARSDMFAYLVTS